jgi:hypothetical protein
MVVSPASVEYMVVSPASGGFHGCVASLRWLAWLYRQPQADCMVVSPTSGGLYGEEPLQIHGTIGLCRTIANHSYLTRKIVNINVRATKSLRRVRADPP